MPNVVCLVVLSMVWPGDPRLGKHSCSLKTALAHFPLCVDEISDLRHLRIPLKAVKHRPPSDLVLPGPIPSRRVSLHASRLQVSLQSTVPMRSCRLDATLLMGTLQIKSVIHPRKLPLEWKVLTNVLLLERLVTTCSLIREQLESSNDLKFLFGMNVD